MKKLFFVFVMLCIGALCVNAQDRIATGGRKSFTFSIGPKAGGSYNFISEPSNLNVGLKGGIGYGGGLALNAHFGRKTPSSPGGTGLFGVQLEGTFNSKSFSSENAKMTVSGVDVPILFQIYPIPVMCIEIGPAFEFYKIKSNAEIASHGTRVGIDGQSGVYTMLSVGIGLHLTKGFTMDLRYNYGLNGLNQSWPAKISSVSLGIGWLFKVIK